MLHLSLKFAAAAVIATALTAASADTDPMSRLIHAGTHRAATRAADLTPAFYPAIIEIDDDSRIDELRAMGVDILRRRDELLLAYIPSTIDPSAIDVTAVCAGRSTSMTMDIARSYAGVDDIATGNGLPHPFDGTGTVTGFCDIGFDPCHPAFAGRVGRVVHYIEDAGERHDYTDAATIAAWGSDTRDEWHATHVAGILAGRCDALPYNGVATGARIVGTVSSLSDVALLAGAEDIVEYAREAGMPAVVNMSVGSYTGPHDGTSLFNRYLDKLGREAIVCLSAGNEGSKRNTIAIEFSDGRREATAMVIGTDWVFFNLEGYIDLWSDDDTPLDVAIGIVDDTDHTVVYRGDYFEVPADGSPAGVTTADTDGLIRHDPALGQYLEGTVTAAAGVNPRNGRYNLTVAIDTRSTARSVHGAWARYTPALIVKGEPGKRVNVFADGRLTFRPLAGEPTPGAGMSVSDLATGHNLVCVGMYTTRTSTPVVDGADHNWGGAVASVNPGSGYMTLADGRVLPDVCAPGAMIVAPMSGIFKEAHPEAETAATADVEGRSAYWAANGGTSMSSPFTAGVIATWLQACPTLTIDDVKEIIAMTRLEPANDPTNPANGQGWLDARAGLLEAIARNAAGTPGAPVVDCTAVTLTGRTLTVVNPCPGRAAAIAVFNTAGATVATTATDAPTAAIDLSHLPAGIYIVAAEGTKATRIALTGR